MNDDWAFATKAIHAGQQADQQTGAVTVPIFQTSTYRQDSVGKVPFSVYGRVDNPTRSALQTSLSTLEGARYGLAFASGLAATDTLLRTLSPDLSLTTSSPAYECYFSVGRFAKTIRRGRCRQRTRQCTALGVGWVRRSA